MHVNMFSCRDHQRYLFSCKVSVNQSPTRSPQGILGFGIIRHHVSYQSKISGQNKPLRERYIYGIYKAF